MEESYFDGGLFQFIGYKILGVLVTVLTVGICLPWSFTMIYRWETEHTVINGRRLVFDGSAVGLFGNWIKWLFLSIITLGIYSLWVSISLRKWKTKHTFRSYEPAGTESYFDGGLLQLVGYRILGAIITVCTLGICLPWESMDSGLELN